MHLKAAAINYSNFFTIQELAPGVYEGVNGVEFELLQILSKALNFTYEVLQPDDRSWGILKEDGNWTGMIGMLDRKEADLAIDRIHLTSERSEAVDYALPYYMDFDTFAVKRAGVVPKTFFFAHPFRLSVWILIALALLSSSFFLYGLQRLDLPRESKPAFVNLKRMFAATELLVGNGEFGNSFQRCSTRIFFLLNALPIMVLMLSFSGLLLSFLMNPIMEHQIQTVEELAEASASDKVKVVVFKGTVLDLAFRQAETGIHRDLAKNVRNNPKSMPRNYVQWYLMMLEGYAIMHSKISITTHVRSSGLSEEVFISNDSLHLILVTIMFKKGFPAVNDFNRIVRRVMEAGIYEKLMQDMFFRHDAKKRSQESPVELLKPIVIQDFIGVFGLLICGCVLAVIAFICEIYTHALKKKKSKNRRLLRLQRRQL